MVKIRYIVKIMYLRLKFLIYRKLLFLLLAGIYMHHAVLYLGEVLLDGVMDAFGDGVCIHQALQTIGGDFHVDIATRTKGSCSQQVQAADSFLVENDGANLLNRLFLAGTVDHLVGPVAEYLHTDTENEEGYDDGCNGIGDRVPHAGKEDADQAAGGGQHIAV